MLIYGEGGDFGGDFFPAGSTAGEDFYTMPSAGSGFPVGNTASEDFYGAGDYGQPAFKVETIPTQWGDLNLLGNLAQAGAKIFGTVTSGIAQAEQARAALDLSRENAALIRDTRRAESEMLLTQGRQALDLARVRGNVEVAKAQTELTRANALDRFYSENPVYAVTGIPETVTGTGLATWVWLAALAGVGIWLATRKG